ncbi:MAG: Na+/H+ antiporter NhaA [Pseudomonadales bacterium]
MAIKDTAKNFLHRGKVYTAPWENALDKILTPFEEFIHRQSTSGILLLLCGVIALVIANTDLYSLYQSVIGGYFSVGTEDFRLSMSVHHWVNDGLMAFFFLLVGLELKREFLVGELAERRKAVVPIMAAIGGMVVPALCYYAINPEGVAANGWGIPMATDIAFAVGILAILGDRVPKSLLMFLVALAIVDDLGAILVIAVFYTHDLQVDGLFYSAIWVAMLAVLNLAGVRKTLPYLLVGLLLWLALHYSGVHATLAGVLTAFAIPARPKYDPLAFSSRVERLMDRFRASIKPGEDIMRNEELRAVVQSLSAGVSLVQAPLQKLEHNLHIPVTYMVIPIFALVNAGIPLAGVTGENGVTSPISIGIMFGLLVGKPAGIVLATFLAVKLGWGNLPAGCRFSHILGVGFLGGIGFTMSIFIADLGFLGQPDALLMAKTGVLVGSFVAGVLGYLILRLSSTGTVSKPGSLNDS